MSGILDAILRGLNSPKAGMLEVSEHEEDEMLEKVSPPFYLPSHGGLLDHTWKHLQYKIWTMSNGVLHIQLNLGIPG